MRENNIICTNWTEATNNPSKAMLGLISCLESGYNAWIELRKNGEQDYPIKIKNPMLDNPFNWTMSYGVPRNEKDMMNYNYFNDTEKDLTYNWVACFGKEESIIQYQEHGLITKDLCLGMGRCHPVRIKDANKYRIEIIGDNYQYNYWVTYWKPSESIQYWAVDETQGDVFTICYNNEEYDKSAAMKKAADFLYQYSNKRK